MNDAMARQQFPTEAEAAYTDTLRSNKVYRATDVKAYVMSRIRGGNPARPDPVPLNPTELIAEL